MAVLVGTKSKDTLRGGAGADTITGADGKDKLYGGDGLDRILGGEGDDLLEGEGGDDWLDGGDDDDTVNGGAGADSLFGYDGDDVIDGGADNDRIDAGEGDDEVQGGDGADTVQGGDGKDELFGGAGADQLYGGDGKDDLDGSEGDDALDGGGGNDRLTGGLGNDLVQGGAGNDTIVYGEGFDTLLGGTGSDSFDLRNLLAIGGLGQPFKTQFIDGGDGGDTVGFNLARSAVTLQTDANGVTRVFFGGETLAELSRVEKIAFGSGGTVTLPPPPANPPPPPQNANPVAGADTATTGENATVVVQTRGNDSDADGHPLTVTGLNAAGTLGQVSILDGSAGTITYNPGSAFNGLRQGQQATDTFIYTVSDGHGGQATATVTVTVNGANDGPILVSPLADAAALAGQALNLTLPAGAFSDPDIGDTLTLSAKLANGSDLPAWLAFNPATRTFQGSPPAAEVLSIRITATDVAGASVSDDFSLSVTTSGGPPVAGPDVLIAALTGQTVQLRIDAPTDPDGDTLTAVIDVLPDFGTFHLFSAAGAAVSVGQTLTMQELQSLVFVAPGEAHDEQALLYTVSDGHGGQDQGGVTIAVHPAEGILVDVRASLVFSGVDPTLGRELFTLTPGGAALRLADINPGLAGSAPGELTLLDGVLYFAADKAGLGRELFKLDHNSVVALAANIATGANSSFPSDLYAFGDDLFFRGSFAGIPLLQRVHEDLAGQATSILRDPSDFIAFGGDLYFTAREAITGGGFWLYKLDGETGEFVKVPGAPTTLGGSERLVYNDTLYFIGFTNAAGRELWKVDASGQASMVSDTYLGGGASDPHDFTVMNGALYFLDASNTTGLEVYRLAGGVPQVVAETWAGPSNGLPTELTAFNGRLFFQGHSSTASNGRELLQIADPTGANPAVTLFHDFNTSPFPYNSASPHNLAVVGAALYLTANASPGSVPNWQNWRVNADFSLTHLTALDGKEVDFTKAVLTEHGIFLGDPAGFLDPLTGSFVALAGVSDVDEITPFTFFDYAALSLAGGAGRDTLIGTDKNDNLTGAGGDDAIQGGKGLDTLSGGDGADNIGGGDEADVIYGGAGNDVIDAGDGDDLITPGAGDDFINGGAGTDTVSYADALSGITIDLSKLGTAQSTGGSGTDQHLGVEVIEATNFADHFIGTMLAETLKGFGGDDRLEGGAGDDVLIGGDGHDILIGGNGSDTLTGGAGVDWFVFENMLWPADVITDFEEGIDKIFILTAGFENATPGELYTPNSGDRFGDFTYDPNFFAAGPTYLIATFDGHFPIMVQGDILMVDFI